MGRPRIRWERIPPDQPTGAPLTEAMELLLGHLGGKPWGKVPRSTATFKALEERGLTEIVDDGRTVPHTKLTGLGMTELARLDAARVGRG